MQVFARIPFPRLFLFSTAFLLLVLVGLFAPKSSAQLIPGASCAGVTANNVHIWEGGLNHFATPPFIPTEPVPPFRLCIGYDERGPAIASPGSIYRYFLGETVSICYAHSGVIYDGDYDPSEITSGGALLEISLVGPDDNRIVSYEYIIYGSTFEFRAFYSSPQPGAVLTDPDNPPPPEFFGFANVTFLYSNVDGFIGGLVTGNSSLGDSCSPSTPTPTPTPSSTPTETSTPTPTETPSPTPTTTPTETSTPTPTETSTPTSTPTLTPTSTATGTATLTPTATSTSTLTPTATTTGTATLTPTATSTPTLTPTSTATSTRATTRTPTATTSAGASGDLEGDWDQWLRPDATSSMPTATPELAAPGPAPVLPTQPVTTPDDPSNSQQQNADGVLGGRIRPPSTGDGSLLTR